MAERPSNGLRYPMIGIARLRMEIDGDGVTTLVVSKGCTLRCKYCLNPQCFCGSVPIRYRTVSELVSELRIDDLYFKATGGGVVFGGGEPLLQADFIAAFAEERPKEWRLLMETALNVPEEALQKVLPYIDEFIVDIKDLNPDIYRAYTGVDNSLVRSNLKVLLANGPEKVVLRIPLIPGCNTEEDCERSISGLRKMGFTRFDRFRYETEAAERKRAVCENEEQQKV